MSQNKYTFNVKTNADNETVKFDFEAIRPNILNGNTLAPSTGKCVNWKKPFVDHLLVGVHIFILESHLVKLNKSCVFLFTEHQLRL